MAYVFDQINDALDEGNKTNIFAPTTPDQSQAQGSNQAQSQSGAQGDTKTSDDSIGFQQNSGTPNKASQVKDTSPDQQANVLTAQAAKIKVPTATAQYGQDLTNASQQLQNEANTYVQGYKDYDYTNGVNNDLVSKAAGNDQDSYTKVAQRLAQQGPTNYQAFTPTTKTTLDEIGNLNNASGIQQMFRAENGPQYTNQDAAFDQTLLVRNPEFQKIQQALQRQQSDLQTAAATAATNSSAQAQAIANQGYLDATSGIKGSLNEQSQNVLSGLADRAAAENQRRQGLDLNSIAGTQAQQDIDTIKGNWGNADGLSQRAIAQLSLSGIDPSKYISSNLVADPRSLATADDSSRFNRVMGLLNNNTDTLNVGSGAPPDYNLDNASLQKAIQDAALGKENTLESGYTKDIADILQQAKDYSAWQNSQRNRGPLAYAQSINDDLAKQLPQNSYLNEALHGGVDPNAFYKAGDKLGDTATLSPAQVAQLNDLAAKTGQTANYAVGSGLGNTDTFDSAGYLNAMKGYIADHLNAQAAKDKADSDKQRDIELAKTLATHGIYNIDKQAGSPIGHAVDRYGNYVVQKEIKPVSNFVQNISSGLFS